MPRRSKPKVPERRWKFGQRLKELRGELTQAEAGKIVGISAGYVSNLESGRYQATTDILEGYERLGGDYNELAELAGLLRRRTNGEWVPPPDKASQLRSLAEQLTPDELWGAVRMLTEFYKGQVRRDLPNIPPEPRAEEEGKRGTE